MGVRRDLGWSLAILQRSLSRLATVVFTGVIVSVEWSASMSCRRDRVFAPYMQGARICWSRYGATIGRGLADEGMYLASGSTMYRLPKRVGLGAPRTLNPAASIAAGRPRKAVIA